MTYKYLVTAPLAPLLLRPDSQSELADEALYGMALNILETQDQWCYVDMEYKYRGWMHRSDISETCRAEWIEGRNALIQSPFAEVMPDTTYRGQPILNIPRGSSLVLLNEACQTQGWCKVELHDGRRGFCRTEWIRPHSDFPSQEDQVNLRQRIVSDALSYMGTHYKWGGKSPAGIDCSGLTFMAHWMNGLWIYRDASIQPGYLVHESQESASKPGDLLFFPGHIALYLGDGQYVHSTGSQGGVVINSLDKNSERYHKALHNDLYAWGTIF